MVVDLMNGNDMLQRDGSAVPDLGQLRRIGAERGLTIAGDMQRGAVVTDDAEHPMANSGVNKVWVVRLPILAEEKQGQIALLQQILIGDTGTQPGGHKPGCRALNIGAVGLECHWFIHASTSWGIRRAGFPRPPIHCRSHERRCWAGWMKPCSCPELCCPGDQYSLRLPPFRIASDRLLHGSRCGAGRRRRCDHPYVYVCR